MANSMLYGFYQLKDYANQRAIEMAPATLRDAIILSTEQYNAEIRTLLNLFAEPTNAYKLRFDAATNNRLQPMDQFGRALPVKGSRYDVAYPIQMGGTAWGTNFVTRAKRTVADMAKDTANMFTGDRNWVADHVLAALFYNGSGWTFTDEQYGALTIIGLANGDGTLYARVGGVPATDNHYLAQAGGIVDATNPFAGIFIELMEHPENAGAQVVSFVNGTDRGSVEALATFRPMDDPNVREADTLSVVTGNLGANIPGAGVFGRVSNQWVAQWDRVPATYILSVAVGGIPPLAIREDPEAELQGFRSRGERDDYPFFESQWFRRCGLGAWNRVGAVVTRTGNGAYAIPTNFGSPMA
jgi:hypothetical protein